MQDLGAAKTAHARPRFGTPVRAIGRLRTGFGTVFWNCLNTQKRRYRRSVAELCHTRGGRKVRILGAHGAKSMGGDGLADFGASEAGISKELCRKM